MPQSSSLPVRPDRQRVVKILVPRNNTRDTLSAEQVLTTLGDPEPFGLELIGTSCEKAFQIRGAPPAVDRVLAQIRHAYPQCEFEEVPFADDVALQPGHVRRVIELRLREGAHLPLRTHISRDGRTTHDDLLQGGDPLIGVLAAMDHLKASEMALVQLMLRPMPPDWSKYWRGSLRDLESRTRFTPSALAATLFLAMGISLLGLAVTLGVLMLALRSTAMLAWLVGLALTGTAMLIVRFHLSSPPDPALVRIKINASAFRARIRIFVTAMSDARAEQRMRQLISAFNAYNLAGGNGFVARELDSFSHPRTMTLPSESRWAHLPVLGFMRRPDAELPILNTAELALLWHLPHANAGMQDIAAPTAKNVMPLDADIAEGIVIGQSRHQGVSKQVRLPPESLKGNIGLVARTQSGKSNLMALIAAQVMATEPDTAVIVLDPHRRLAQTLTGLIPANRRSNTTFLSLAEREHPFGLNLIDRSKGRDRPFTDKLVSDIISTLTEIWPDNWGPRMENYLRWALLTLAHANEVLFADHAFWRWRATVTQVFNGLEPHIKANTLTRAHHQMIFDDYLAFTQLTRPPLGKIADQYDGIVPLYADYAEARKIMLRGETLINSDYLRAIDALRKATQAWATRHSPQAGISRRTYERNLIEGERPLQFTLLDVGPLLLHGDFRRSVLGALASDELKHLHTWWDDSYQVYRNTNMRLLLEMIQPVLSKMDRFNASTEARRIFGQPESTIDVADVINNGGILIVDLAAGVVGQDTAALIGSTLMNWVATALFARQGSGGRVTRRQGDKGIDPVSSSPLHLVTPSSSLPRQVLIVIDEFQSLPGINYPFILSELGKYGARMLMGTQSLAFLDQVNERARASWLDNTGTLFVFRSGADDAQVLSRELSITDDNPLTITPNDIVGLPDYTCYVRLRNKRGQPRVFRLQTDRVPESEAHIFNAVRTDSIQRHCRDADTVDSWIKDAQQWQGKSDFGQSNSHGHHSAEAGGRQPETIHGDPPPEKSGSPEDAARERARIVMTGSESGRSVRRTKRVAPVDDLSTHANDTANTTG